MGTTLDIKIKRANKVYHAGVSGGVSGFKLRGLQHGARGPDAGWACPAVLSCVGLGAVGRRAAGPELSLSRVKSR